MKIYLLYLVKHMEIFNIDDEFENIESLEGDNINLIKERGNFITE